MEIKFGTSGWRAIIAEDFTFDNVKLVTQAIAEHVKSTKEQVAENCVIVGYDPRFLSEEFAKTSSGVLAGNDIRALYCKRDTPTPVLSYEIVRRKLIGGINFTASHNPPEYHGLKFSPYWGGPALPETTKEIERLCKEKDIVSRIKEVSFSQGIKNKLIQEIDPGETYIKRIKELVDLKVIKKAKLKIGIDLLYGTARGYLDTLIKETDCKTVVIHNYRDVLFNGQGPKPDEERLKELKNIMKEQKLNLGIATDGDADRFGIIDSDGTFITPNQVIAVLLYYLVKNRGWKGVTARSVMTTHFIDAIAEKYGIEVKETPVGFKYIGDIMVNNPEDFIIGGEESGGLTIRKHIPEKDGVLACLLIAEMVAEERKSIKDIIQDIERQVGRYTSKRVNFHLSQENMDRFKQKLQGKPPPDISGNKIKKIVTIDGFKFILEDNSWIGIRLSGTEPVVRLYVETSSEEKLQSLISAGERFVKGNFGDTSLN